MCWLRVPYSRSWFRWLGALTRQGFHFLLLIQISWAAVPCGNQKDPSVVTQTFSLSRLMKRDSADLQKLYVETQGDSYESFCHMKIDGVPDPSVEGLDDSDRLQSIYSKLRILHGHISVVARQQEQQLMPTDPLLVGLTKAKVETSRLAGKVSQILQELRPNEPITEPVKGPTGAPVGTTFQQKLYACVVLTCHKEFLANVVKELRFLKSKCSPKAVRRNSLL